jgi:hypothetical protein
MSSTERKIAAKPLDFVLAFTPTASTGSSVSV